MRSHIIPVFFIYFFFSGKINQSSAAVVFSTLRAKFSSAYFMSNHNLTLEFCIFSSALITDIADSIHPSKLE